MNTKAVQEEYHAFLRAKQKSVALRKEWPSAKKVILKTLKKLVADLSIDAKIKVEDKMQGMEIIYLTFGKEASGIWENVGKTKRPLIKEGGHLFYAQLYNGNIGIWKTLPNIKKLMNASAPAKVGVHLPSEITEGIVLENVVNFLKSLTEWEDQELDRDSIGYKLR